jgi:hypothetical protein
MRLFCAFSMLPFLVIRLGYNHAWATCALSLLVLLVGRCPVLNTADVIMLRNIVTFNTVDNASHILPLEPASEPTNLSAEP